MGKAVSRKILALRLAFESRVILYMCHIDSDDIHMSL